MEDDIIQRQYLPGVSFPSYPKKRTRLFPEVLLQEIVQQAFDLVALRSGQEPELAGIDCDEREPCRGDHRSRAKDCPIAPEHDHRPTEGIGLREMAARFVSRWTAKPHIGQHEADMACRSPCPRAIQ
jgi:hypothetical protein